MKIAVLLVFAAVTTALVPGIASAEVNPPWCIVTGGTSEGVMSCGYFSLAQCMQTRVGTDQCVPNPRYQGSAAPARERGRR